MNEAMLSPAIVGVGLQKTSEATSVDRTRRLRRGVHVCDACYTRLTIVMPH